MAIKRKVSTGKRKINLGKGERSPVTAKGLELSVKRKLNKLLRSYNDAETEVARLQATMSAAKHEAQSLLDENGLRFYASLDGVAEYQGRKGNKSSVIDIAGFKKLCKTDADFMSAVTVTKKAAEKILTSNELEKITTIIPAKEKEPVFIIRRVE